MEKSSFKVWIFILILTAMAGCSLQQDDEVQRTYPEAFDYELVNLQELLETRQSDSLNAEVYVTAVLREEDCPNEPNVSCFGDGVFLSEVEMPSDEETRYPISTEEPRQFQKGSRYIMSFFIEHHETEDGYSIQLAGYSIVAE